MLEELAKILSKHTPHPSPLVPFLLFSPTPLERIEFDFALVVLSLNCLLCLALSISIYYVYKNISNVDSAYPRLWPPLILFFIATGVSNITALFSFPLLYISSKTLVLVSLVWLSISFIRLRPQIELSASILRKVKTELDLDETRKGDREREKDRGRGESIK